MGGVPPKNYQSRSQKGGPAPPNGPRAPRHARPALSNVCLDEERVRLMIVRLKEQSSAGHDEILNKFIKETFKKLSRPLSILISKSMSEKTIPDDWRYANVTPIYQQKGAKSEPENNRPVSFTSATGKLMERIVKEDIERHLESKGLIGNSQHGFRYGRSPQTILIEFMEQTTEWIGNGKPFDVVYLDFAKAFDKVCLESLLVKYKAVGICWNGSGIG